MESICFNNINWLSEFNILYLKEANESIIKDLIPESLTTKCFSCGTKFTTFLNRSNRCIICLRLFCNSCIIKLKGKFCKKCLNLCKKFNEIIGRKLIQTTENNITFLEMRETFYCKTFLDEQIISQEFITKENNNFEQKLLVNLNDTYVLIIKTFINYILKINFDDENIVSEWFNKIYILIKETIANLHPCSKFLNDSLNINDYIKIKIIPYKDTSKCQVIQGYVLHNKKKVNNHIKDNIDNPKILLLNKKIDENEEKSKKYNNINVNKDIQIYYLKLIENKIGLIKPDIIIIGKHFPKYIVDIMINNNFDNISVIYDVDDNVMAKLSRCFQTLILPSIHLIGSNNILGCCKRFYTHKISEIDNNNDLNDVINNEENKNKNVNDLYIFDGCDRLLFSTIILSGPDINLLKKLKRLLKQILIPSIRDLFLQKYIQYALNMEINPVPEENEIETDFIEELYEESYEITPLGRDSIYNMKNKGKQKERFSSQKILKLSSKKTDINQLFYEGFDLSIIEKKEDFNIYSIISLTSSQKNKLEKKNSLNEEKEEEITEKEIHNIVNKYCEASKELNLSFFSENYDYDLPLGKFILNLCSRSNLVCPTCNLEYRNHTQYLYRAKGVLKLWMISGNEYNLDKIFKYLNETTNIDYSKLLPFKENIYSISEINEMNIFTYGYCNICKGIVTPLFKISNEVYNYSSSKFLRFMLENHLSRNQKRNFNYNISNLIANHNCEHQINKNISRIFITRFGSWVFEYNDIIKHYISPMYLNVNDSFSKNILFTKYEEEAYSNCMDTLSLIKNALSAQEQFFNEILKDNKLFIFKDLIKSIRSIILSIKIFTEQYMVEFLDKYLKTNNNKYNNSCVRLIAYIKKIYLKIVKIKLVTNRIERLKINIKVIYDILNNKIPLTFEENNKLMENLLKEKKNDSSNRLDYITSGMDFSKESSFTNILSFINYTDNHHDYFSCEFNEDDLASFIANTLSSNEYIKSMNLKNGLNLATIKCKRNNSNEIFNTEIGRNLFRRKRRFSSFKQIQEKNIFFKEIDQGISRKMSLDENKDEMDLLDIMLVFDQSKQYFYIEEENKQIYTNKLIKKILEEELVHGQREQQTFYLSNDLYSLLIKEKKKDEDLKIQKMKSEVISNNSGSSKKLTKINSNEDLSLEKANSAVINRKNDNEENENLFFNKIKDKNDFNKITIYFKEIENQLNDLSIKLKELREKLINIIKNRIEIIPYKEIKKNKDFNDDKDFINDGAVIDNIETNEDKNKNNDIIKENINTNDKNINEKDKNERDKFIQNPEDNLPIFQNVPEFEKITNLKLHVFFEENIILKDINKIEIILYYPKQFEALRLAYCATLEDFLGSLSKSGEWSKNTGGKSKASFYKTFDERFILKDISENEFNMFLDNGLEYFQYISRYLFHKMPSALAKILGVYKIITKQKNKDVKYYLVLMENIFYGTDTNIKTTFNSPDSNIRVYDLKGSNINRYISKNMRKPGQVLLDTNFLVDFNKEPVFIDSNSYDRLKVALYNDTMYLKHLEVVDYSLLIIFDDKDRDNKQEFKMYYEYNTNTSFSSESGKRLIKMGIIDYIRKYTWDKKMEFYGKSFFYGEDPTIVDPNVYSDRFYKRISKYFVGV